MANKVKFGLSNFHYAIATEGTDGAVTYSAWKSMPNVQSMTADVNSNSTKAFADNILIYEAIAISGASLSVQFSLVPDEFKKEVLGWRETTKGLVQPTDAVSKKIAVAFEVEGDEKKRVHWYFLCSVTDPNNDDNTTNGDSATIGSETLTISAYPVKMTDGIHYLKEKLEMTEAEITSFFGTTPTLPTFKTA